MKKFWISGLAAAFSVMLIMPSHAGEWIQDTSRAVNDNGLSNWWYRNDDGTYPAGGWFWIDGNSDGLAESYRFNEAGWMYADTVVDGYTVDASGMWTLDGVVQRKRIGTARESTKEEENDTGRSGAGSNGSHAGGDGTRPDEREFDEEDSDREESGDSGREEDGDTGREDHDDSSGYSSGTLDHPRNEWRTDETGRQYFGADGKPVVGWKKIDGSTYCFDDAGYALTGFQEVDGKNYYFYFDGERAETTVHSREDGVYYVVAKKEYYVLDVVPEAEWSDYKRNADRDIAEITRITDENKAEDQEDTAEEPIRHDEGLNDEMAMECFDLVNEERIRAGVEPLVYNEEVMEACRIRAGELAEKYSHTRPDGSPFVTVLDEVGLLY